MDFVFTWRKKPVQIEAMAFDGTTRSARAIMNWACSVEDGPSGISLVGDNLAIATLEGQMTASRGDWIIRGVNGEFYPCKPDIFDKTYEPVMRRCDAAACNCGGSHQVTRAI